MILSAISKPTYKNSLKSIVMAVYCVLGTGSLKPSVKTEDIIQSVLTGKVFFLLILMCVLIRVIIFPTFFHTV